MFVIDVIHSKYDDLTKTQRKICDYLLSNTERICYISLARLSQEINCSEITILNLCKALGYANFIELKQAFREYTEYTVSNYSTYSIKKPVFNNKNIESNELIKNIIEEDRGHINNFFENLDIKLYKSIAGEIIRANCIYILGHDFSFKMGEFLQKRLDILNLSTVATDLGDMYKTEFTISQMTENDIAIMLSFPHYYYATETIARAISKRVSNFILITDKKSSPAYQYASKPVCCHNSTPIFINSWLTTMAFINILTNIVATETE